MINEWNQINNQTDIENLRYLYNNFHDSCICSMEYKSGAYVDEKGSMHGIHEEGVLVARFDSQSPRYHLESVRKSLELKFVGLRRMNLIGFQDNYFCEILSFYLSFYKDYIIWSEDDSFDPDNYGDNELLKEPMSTFIIANRLEWRFVD